MATSSKPSGLLLGVGIVLICVGLAMFVIKPLIATPLVIVGVVVVVVASSKWAGRSNKTPHHYATHKKPHR